MEKSQENISPRAIRKLRSQNLDSLAHAGAAIRLTARRSIKKGGKKRGPGPPGQPPRTRRGRLKKSILYAVERDRQRVTIGPDYMQMGTSAAAHEHGGKYKKERFPKRPFMGPALEKIAPRLPRHWARSVR